MVFSNLCFLCLLNVETRFQKHAIKATDSIAVFVFVWLLNSPALIVR